MEVTVALHSHGRTATVLLSGELDLASTTELDRAIDDLLAAGCARIEVDLSELGFCDSFGLNGLVRARNRCRARGGTLEVVNPAGEVAEVISIAGLFDSLTPDA